jgi:hypothetical protein
MRWEEASVAIDILLTTSPAVPLGRREPGEETDKVFGSEIYRLSYDLGAGENLVSV